MPVLTPNWPGKLRDTDIMLASSPTLVHPTSVHEALGELVERPGARIIAGGTQVMAEQGLGRWRPNGYVSLRRVEDLAGASASGEQMHIGPRTTLRDLVAVDGLPTLLRDAIRALAVPQVRNRGTVGGNIGSPRPDHTLPPCLIALNARINVTTATGTAVMTVPEWLGRGDPAPAIIRSIHVPTAHGGHIFARVGPRNGPSYATASLALVVDPVRRTVRTGLGGVGVTALTAEAADEYAAAAIDWEHLTIDVAATEYFAELVARATAPITDHIATAAYRTHAIRVMARRSLPRACEGARS